MRFILELTVLVIAFGTATASMAVMGSHNTRADLEKIILDINGQPAQVQTMVADKK